MANVQQQIEQFLYLKSELCDKKDWDAYLDLFDQNSEFHVPQWDSEDYYTQDPKREMSLIYYANRNGLEDRVFRLRTGKSAASHPLPRTVHLINNVRVKEQDQFVEAKVNWVTYFSRIGTAGCFFGYATYHLIPYEQSWKIKKKHVVLVNDKINSVLDFYHL